MHQQRQRPKVVRIDSDSNSAPRAARAASALVRHTTAALPLNPIPLPRSRQSSGSEAPGLAARAAWYFERQAVIGPAPGRPRTCLTLEQRWRTSSSRELKEPGLQACHVERQVCAEPTRHAVLSELPCTLRPTTSLKSGVDFFIDPLKIAFKVEHWQPCVQLHHGDSGLLNFPRGL